MNTTATVITIDTAWSGRIPVTLLGRTDESIHVVLPSGLDAWVQPRSLKREDPAMFTASVKKAPSVNLDPVTEPGMYRHGEDILKVQRSKSSDNLYAKRLVMITGQRLSEDAERVPWEFVYEQGAIRTLKASDRMTVEQARAFGIQYGVCCVCGAFLKDATSVENGIGPVCAKRV